MTVGKNAAAAAASTECGRCYVFARAEMPCHASDARRTMPLPGRRVSRREFRCIHRAIHFASIQIQGTPCALWGGEIHATSELRL